MNRISFLKILNPIIGLLLVNQIVSSTFRHYISHETFEMIHPTGGILLTIGIGIHIGLNANWIKANYFKKKNNS